MVIEYIRADLFKACRRPSILAHACNTHGIWGGGIALTFAKEFPSAEIVYEHHCAKNKPSQIIGTCLLINSAPEDPGNKGLDQTQIIACLFTSAAGGLNADQPLPILENTRKAIKDLERQLCNDPEDFLLKAKPKTGIWTVEMPKINSGIFRTPWEQTEAILKESSLNYNVFFGQF